MHLRPREFIDFASELGRTQDTTPYQEPSRRTAINRAYLGALLEMSTVLEAMLTKEYPQDHTFYELVESDCMNVFGSGIKDKLSTLRFYRKESDYSTEAETNEWRPQQAVNLAREIVRIADEKQGS